MVHLEIDANKCTGCRTCQIACSFHHRRVFSPKIASLEIRTGQECQTISISLYKDLLPHETGKHIPCDNCGEESIALCAKYCPVGAIKLENDGVPSHE